MADDTDRITLTGLRVHGYHGVYDRERASGQEFVVDVTLRMDTTKAAQSDNIVDTIHYGTLADALADSVAGSPVQLVETLAEQLAQVCLADTRVDSCVVTVHKPQAPIPHTFADVSVTIERSRP